MLEIGVGNGFVADYLRQRGYDVVTLDINPALSVDVLGSITAVPLADDSFDVVCAFEVLEHLPTPLVADALSEMLRVTRDTAVVSVPNERITYPVQLPIPRIGVCRWLLDRCDPPDHVSAPEHLWEIGDGEVSVEDVREWIVEAGFSLVRDYRPFHNPRHHFFVLATL